MNILDAQLPFVNDQVGIQERLAKKFAADPSRQKLHLATGLAACRT